MVRIRYPAACIRAAARILTRKDCWTAWFTPDLYRRMQGDTPELNRAIMEWLDFWQEEGARDLFEIGCGIGLKFEWCHTRGIAWRGMEVNRNAARYARDRGIDVMVGVWPDAEMDISADLILSTSVIDHSTDPDAFLARAVRKARRGLLVSSYRPTHEGSHHRLNWDWKSGSYTNNLSLPRVRSVLSDCGIPVSAYSITRIRETNPMKIQTVIKVRRH